MFFSSCAGFCNLGAMILNGTQAVDMVNHVTGFDYTIECYLPEAKRKHGYFVLPILWKDALIGRLDAKAERKAQTLLIKKLLFEPAVRSIDEALPSLSEALAQFARFNGCKTIAFDIIVPTGHKRKLKTLVQRALRALASN